MAQVILSFVNLGRQDAFLSVADASGDSRFVTKLPTGQATRQVSTTGQQWNIVSGDSYSITAGDENRAYLISANGVYEVTATQAVKSESGVSIDDTDFRSQGGGG